MTEIYSRSYGSIESDGRTRPKITVPPDYHGSMYADSKKYEPEPPAQEPKREDSPADKPNHTEPATTKPASSGGDSTHGLLGGLLEKISAEDLIMFGLVLAMLLGDAADNVAILAIILAIVFT